MNKYKRKELKETMEKALLYCPREMVFTDNGIYFNPVVPKIDTPLSGSMLEIAVDILQVDGNKALVLLPELLRKGEQETVIVGLQHLI